MEIKLPMFEGPLDLLLHLIRKKELDIYQVRLSELTTSYLAYLHLMETLNLDLAGEFLEIAATLILLKSRQLLPKPRVVEELGEEDPEELLRKRLIEYQRFKDAAFQLGSLDILGREVFSRPIEEDLVADAEEQFPQFEEVSLYALMDAFRKVLNRQPKITTHVVKMESYRIEDRIEELIQLFQKRSTLLFEELFELTDSRSRKVITLMAMLEMVKLKMLRIVQLSLLGPIHCVAHDLFEQQASDWQGQQEEEEVELEVA